MSRRRAFWLGVAAVSGAGAWWLTAVALAGRLAPGDTAVRDFMLAHRVPALDWFMLAVSWAGSEYVTPALLVVLLAFLWRRHRRVVLYGVGIVATSAVWQLALKAVVGRPRPEPLLYPVWHGAGFPSGHVLTAVVLTYVLWRMAPTLGLSRRVTTILGLSVWLWPLLVGASRLYLNCHYLSDVAGGLLLATLHLGLTFGLLGARWLYSSHR